MDFGALPPEVNSARIYAGPGPGPMLAAAAAWQRLAVELGSAANAYESVIAELTGQEWLGPAAESMAAAAAPYAAWMGATAVQAEQTATQVTAAASAFEKAYAAMVPPPMIAANRGHLAALVAGNVFGQNTAAIAAAEAQYGEMWTQDTMVMSGYAAGSAAATVVTPFAAPPATTNPAGPVGQAAGVAQTAAGSTHSQLSQLLTAISQALHGAGLTGGSPASLAGQLEPLQSTTPSVSQLASYLEALSRSILPANDANVSVLYGEGQFARDLNTHLDFAAADKVAGSEPLAPAGPAGPGGSEPPAVSGRRGNAGRVGKLAVPSSWMDTTPEVEMAAAALPDTSPAAVPTVAAPAPGGLFADMAVAGLAGGAIVSTAARSRPASGIKGHAQSRLEQVAGELTGSNEVQHWHTDPGRLKSLLAELSEKPGVHEVHVNPAEPEPGPGPQGRG